MCKDPGAGGSQGHFSGCGAPFRPCISQRGLPPIRRQTMPQEGLVRPPARCPTAGQQQSQDWKAACLVCAQHPFSPPCSTDPVPGIVKAPGCYPTS